MGCVILDEKLRMKIRNSYFLSLSQFSNDISFFNFYWSIVDLQCCVSFRCTAK